MKLGTRSELAPVLAPFNTLCGSSANEAARRMRCAIANMSPFNTLCGSSANEAAQQQAAVDDKLIFQYPLRVVSQ